MKTTGSKTFTEEQILAAAQAIIKNAQSISSDDDFVCKNLEHGIKLLLWRLDIDSDKEVTR